MPPKAEILIGAIIIPIPEPITTVAGVMMIADGIKRIRKKNFYISHKPTSLGSAFLSYFMSLKKILPARSLVNSISGVREADASPI